MQARPTAPTADLRITVWPRGQTAAGRTYTLRCGPTGGTLPNRARACRVLLSRADPFKPVPRVAICTAIYGGPAVARVRGTLRGRRVDARFERTDGCQIARWDRVWLLFPGVSVASGR